MNQTLKEDRKCTDCNIELVQYIDDDVSCSCHINPPCSKCTDDREVCPECGEIYENEYVSKHVYKPYIVPPPSCNIDSGIDYTTNRSGAWVQVRGTYKKDISIKEIKNKLGRFDKYHMFKMKNFSNETFSASWCTD